MIKYHFLSAMKLLVFCSVLIIYFASPTAALKCYECDDLHEDRQKNPSLTCKNPSVTTCGADKSQKYCEKASYLDESGVRFKHCNGTCIKKSCMRLDREFICGDPKQYVDIAVSANLFCCQGDLCNGSDKLSNQMNVLLCAVVFSCFHSLVVNLWN